jgi:NAD-dependent dihydropyrimidine dehydrogenase PreA subunit
MNVENYLTEYITDQKVPIFAFTGTDDFEQALPGYQPRELMPLARSLLIFGAPFIEHPRTVDEKTHLTNESWWLENLPVFDQISRWRGEIVNILDNFGYGVANFGGFWLTTEPTFSYRLAMARAGLGVYGRFGICIHPVYGCYFRVGVLLTDAELTPTPIQDRSDFNPCQDCALCAEVCPVKAIDKLKAPETGYNRELCMRFILTIKKRHPTAFEIDPYGVKVCNRCFGVCPYAQTNLRKSTAIKC